jgi:hypothetical protein
VREIVFVNPPYERIAPGYAFVRHVTNRHVVHHYVLLTLRAPTHLLRLLRFGAGYAGAKLRSLLAGRCGLLVQETESLH